jgi:hypothetical protein
MDHWVVFGSVADWAQAISSTVVLVLIYKQMKLTNTQIVQNDDQERFRRSWEFVKLYREELREFERRLESYGDPFSFNPLSADPQSEDFRLFVTNFFRPRIHLFILLNQMVQRQEVDERVLFGYLEDEFNKFVEIGIRSASLQEFKKGIGVKISLLLSLWGTHIKASNLLYSST